MNSWLHNDFDVCVVGGGSGGIGAALAAAQEGARVVLIEASDVLGGNSTRAWVNNWAPVCGSNGIPRTLFERMVRDAPDEVAVQRHVHGYDGTSNRFGVDWEHQHDYARTTSRYFQGEPDKTSVQFEPEALHDAALSLLQEAGALVVFNTRVINATAANGRVQAVEIAGADGEPATVHGRYFIDCTADGNLCAMLGCNYHIGEDPFTRYREPSAPQEPSLRLNAITLVYRIRRHSSLSNNEGIDVPEGEATAVPSAVTEFVNGDLLVNGVSMLEGALWSKLTPGELRAIAEAHVLAAWRALRQHPEYSGYALLGMAPMPGIRETRRFICEYMLTEHDLCSGLSGQRHNDIIATCDHALDQHGSRSTQAREVVEPYGVPLRCLLPQGWANLLIACRGAGFSHLAAASCRLSRTMMALGEAAGVAAVLSGDDIRNVNISQLQQRLIQRQALSFHTL